MALGQGSTQAGRTTGMPSKKLRQEGSGQAGHAVDWPQKVFGNMWWGGGEGDGERTGYRLSEWLVVSLRGDVGI